MFSRKPPLLLTLCLMLCLALLVAAGMLIGAYAGGAQTPDATTVTGRPDLSASGSADSSLVPGSAENASGTAGGVAGGAESAAAAGGTEGTGTGETAGASTGAAETTPPDSPEGGSASTRVVELAAPFISQTAAGAPMGCEGAALLSALQCKGYAAGVSLSTILDNLPLSNDGNPHHGFVGSPYAVDDSDTLFQSIFPRALVPYGSRYGACADITGFSAEQLVAELAAGNPSVVYVTAFFEEARWEEFSFGWCVYNMHVMTLIGYRPTTDQFKVMDPYLGIYWVDGESFRRSYDNLRMSLVVR